jgi:hypothetical protein
MSDRMPLASDFLVTMAITFDEMRVPTFISY